MNSRIARLVFSLLPARAGEFGDACVADAPVTFPPAREPCRVICGKSCYQTKHWQSICKAEGQMP